MARTEQKATEQNATAQQASGEQRSQRDDGVNKTGQDPIVEPDNSTVDDWLGQRVGRDEERVDEALRASDGDIEEAKRRFERDTERSPGQPVADDADAMQGESPTG